MRGVAVLAVLLFHAKESWFPNGYLGVDAFFVVSGFVVTPLINRIFFEKSKINLAANLLDFYRRRFYRLAPGLGVTLITSAVLIFLLGPVSDHERFAKQGLATLFLLGNIGAYRFSGGDYFAPNPNPLIHMWSLSAEEQIYLLLPLILVVFSLFLKSKDKQSLRYLLIAIGFVAYAADQALTNFPQILQSFGVTNVPQLMFYSPLSRLWEFCIGGVSYFLIQRAPESQSRARNVYGAVIAVSLIGILFLAVPSFRFESLVVCLLTAATLHLKVFHTFPIVASLCLRWLGDRSYSIYLVHMPLVYIAHFSPVLADFPTSLTTLVALALSTICGALSFRYVEERFRITSSGSLPVRYPMKFMIPSFLILPILLFSAMWFAAKAGYWQDDLSRHSVSSNAGAWSIDTQCQPENSVIPCRHLVNNAKGEALLIGDSHATAISQAFVDAMARKDYSSYIWTKSSCQPIRQMTMSPHQAKIIGYGAVSPKSSESCFSRNEAIWNWVSSHPKAVIFVSLRSSSAFPQSDLMAFRKLLIFNLLNLDKIAFKIVFVGPNPEFPEVPPRLVWEKPPPDPKSLPISRMVANPEWDNDYYSTELKNTKIDYIDVLQVFCSQDSCRRWDGSGWLYIDGSHLSLAGAEKLIPLLEASLKNLSQ